MTSDITTKPAVLLDFWAPWCKPCLALTPILDRWDRQRLISIVRINVDEEPQIAAQWGVQGLPTLLHLQHGREVGRVTGFLPEPVLRQTLKL